MAKREKQMKCINTLKHKDTIAGKEILFDFFVGDRRYAVLQPNNKTSERCECIEVKWNAWRGFSHVRKIVPEEILSMGNAIIRWHENNARKYPLKGETYHISKTISGGESRISIQKDKGGFCQFWKKNLPMLIRFVIAVIWAVLEVKLCFSTAMKWLPVYLPGASSGILATMIWSTELLGICALFILLPDYRSPVETYINALVPIGTLILLCVSKNYTWVRIAAPIIFAGLATVVYLIFYRGDASTGLCKKVMKATRSALAVIAFICLLNIAVAGTPAFSYKANLVDAKELAGEKLEEEYQTACRKLYRVEWEDYLTQEKLDILQIISDYECSVNLGCDRVNLYSGRTDRTSVLGEYENRNRSVLISQTHLENDDPEKILNTVLHEIRHNFQHRMIDMYQSIEEHIDEQYKDLQVFREIQEYRENFSDYRSGNEDYDEYYRQVVEQDSRNWAEQRIKEFYGYYIYPDR